MSFDSLERSLKNWEEKPELQQLRLFRQIAAHWSEVVGAPVAKHSRPHALNRGALFVATSSSTWAQHLTWQRHQILTKLNLLLAEPILEMRFSTAHWAERSLKETKPTSSTPVASPQTDIIPQATPSDPIAAFQQWAEAIQRRSQQLPLCSQCRCPTPLPEIERWGICALCRVKQLQG